MIYFISALAVFLPLSPNFREAVRRCIAMLSVYDFKFLSELSLLLAELEAFDNQNLAWSNAERRLEGNEIGFFLESLKAYDQEGIVGIGALYDHLESLSESGVDDFVLSSLKRSAQAVSWYVLLSFLFFIGSLGLMAVSVFESFF